MPLTQTHPGRGGETSRRAPGTEGAGRGPRRGPSHPHGRPCRRLSAAGLPGRPARRAAGGRRVLRLPHARPHRLPGVLRHAHRRRGLDGESPASSPPSAPQGTRAGDPGCDPRGRRPSRQPPTLGLASPGALRPPQTYLSSHGRSPYPQKPARARGGCGRTSGPAREVDLSPVRGATFRSLSASPPRTAVPRGGGPGGVGPRDEMQHQDPPCRCESKRWRDG